MGYGPLAYFKGPSSFWARINPGLELPSDRTAETDQTVSVPKLVRVFAYLPKLIIQNSN